jgi:hypothetical protein
MTTTKPVARRRERDAVLGIDGIHTGGNPDDVQEMSGRSWRSPEIEE